MDEASNLLETPARRTPCIPVQNICYGLGHVYNDLCAAVWFSYMLFYFQIVIQMDATTAGTLIMIGQVADSMATPAAGWAVDWIGTPRAWHLTGTVIVTVGFSLMFSVNPGTNHLWSLLHYASLIILFQIGWAIVQISHLTVITTITSNDAKSSDLTAIRYTASVCCNIFVYILTWTILRNSDEDSIGPSDFNKFKEVALIITGLGIISSVIYYSGVNSEENPDGVIRENHDSKRNGGGSSFLKSVVTYQVSLMYMSSRLYTTLNLIYIPLYLNERFTNSNNADVDYVRGAIANVPLVCFFASFITSMVLKNRSQIFNDKLVYAIGGVVSIIGCTWIAIGIPDWGNSQIYGVASFIGIGGSATMVTSLCLTARFVNTNGFKGGSVYSTITFTDKLISGAVVLIIQHLQCENKEMCPKFYEVVLAYATGLAALLGLLSLISLQFHNPTMIHV